MCRPHFHSPTPMCQSRSLNAHRATRCKPEWRVVKLSSPILHHSLVSTHCRSAPAFLSLSATDRSARANQAHFSPPVVPKAWQGPHHRPLGLFQSSLFPSPSISTTDTVWHMCLQSMPWETACIKVHETKNVRILKSHKTCHLVCYHCYSRFLSALVTALPCLPVLSSSYSDTVQAPTSFNTGHLVGFR